MPRNDHELTELLFELAEPLACEEETEGTRENIRRLTAKAHAQKPQWGNAGVPPKKKLDPAENHAPSSSSRPSPRIPKGEDTH